MVDIVDEHLRACRTSGLNITGPVEAFRQAAPSVTPAERQGRFSTIALAAFDCDTAKTHSGMPA